VYRFAARRWAVSAFLFGFGLWIVLIIMGQFFRGPGWAWYWPWESRLVVKPAATAWNLPLPAGLALVAAYYGVGLYLTRGKHLVLWLLTLTMLALPLKMLLRLVFRIHYVLVTPWIRL
jgi:hypothetical protein